MRFKKESLYLGGEPIEFDSDNPPSYLLHKEFNWWYTGYVMKLEVGDSIESDFHKYTRIE